MTDRRLAEESLRESEEKYRRLVEGSPDITYVYGSKSGAVFWSKRVRDILGFKPNELREKPFLWYGNIHSDDVGRVDKAIKATERGKAFDIEYRIFDKKGRLHWLKDRSISLRKSGGEVVVEGIASDITREKQAEQELSDRLEFERLVAETSTSLSGVSIDEIDDAVNETLAKIGVHTKSDRAYIFQFNKGKSMISNTHEWCGPGIKSERKNLQDIHLDKELPWFNKKILSKKTVCVTDVSKLPVAARKEKKHWKKQNIKSLIVLPLIGEGGLSGFIGFDSVKRPRTWSKDEQALLKYLAETITHIIERAESEKTLRESEESLRRAQRVGRMGSWMWDIREDKIAWSDMLYDIWGLAENKKLTRNLIVSRIHPEDRDKNNHEVKKALKSKNNNHEFTFRINAGKNGVRHIRQVFEVERDKKGEVVRAFGIMQDITGLKRYEEEIGSSRNFLDTVVDMSPFAMWVSDEEGLLLRANNSLRKTLNLSDKQIIGKYNVLKDKNLEKQGVMPKVRDVFKKKKPARFSIYWEAESSGINARGGKNLYIDVSLFPITDKDGKLENVVCQWVDVTDRKRAQESLEGERDRVQNYLDIVESMMVALDDKGRITLVNRKACEVLGYGADELLGKSWFANCLPGRNRKGVRGVFKKLMAGELAAVKTYENPVLTKAGEERLVRWNNSFIRGDDGEIKGILSSGEDVTEKNRVQEELARAYAVTPDLLCTGKPDGSFVKVNDAWERVLGYSRQEVLEKGWINLIHPDDVEATRRQVERQLAGRNTANFVNRYLAKDGSYHLLEWMATPAVDGNLYAAARDVTEQKKAEDSIIESERKYSTIFNSASDGIIYSDRKGKILDVNPAFTSITGLSRRQVVGKNTLSLAKKMVGSRDLPRIIKAIKQTLLGKPLQPIELELNGRILEINVPATSGEGVTGVMRDVTEERKSRMELQKSLGEKDALLKEVHHRVKNNLQLITSLLDMQARTISDEKALSIFQDSIARVKSMAIIHERLYRSEEFSAVNLQDYLKKLVEQIKKSHKSYAPHVKIRINARQVKATMETALNCGFIVNELVTNSMKYAFPDGQAGNILVEAGMDGHTLKLSVEDDGAGLPESLDTDKPGTLGLKLVKLFARQLNAQTEIRGEKGTKFTFLMPVGKI